MALLSKKLVLIGFLLFFYCGEVVAQNGFYVSRGLTVSFYFNTLDEMANGITYLNFAEFRAFNNGTHINGPHWELSVRANATFANGLPLEVVEIWANTNPGNGTSLSWQQVPNSLAPITLINNGQIGNNMIISVSYRVGDVSNVNKVRGYPSDYYKADLIFEMKFVP